MRQSLKKLYYQDRALHEETYRSRFHNEVSVHLDFKIHGNPLFLVLTKDIYNKSIQIVKQDKQIVRLLQRLPGVAVEQYRKTCLIDEIVLTNEIEGVHSTRREVDSLLDAFEQQDKHKRFWGITQKYQTLLSPKLMSQIKLKSCQDIREIYDSLVLEEIKNADSSAIPDGTIFRKDSVSVYSATGKEIHRGVYPETAIIENMEKALSYLNTSQEDIILKAGIFHYLFGYIHPFYDGNGRTSRFISAYLMAQNLEPLVCLRLSLVTKQHIHDYYKAFVDCNDPLNRGEITSFVEMFLDIVLDATYQLIDDLGDRYTQMKTLYTLYAPFCEQTETPEVYTNLYGMLTQAALFSEKGISISELCQYMNISAMTLRKKLSVIAEKGLLLSNKYGKKKFYMLDIDALHKQIASYAE